jgi:hypothetical protein
MVGKASHRAETATFNPYNAMLPNIYPNNRAPTDAVRWLEQATDVLPL